MGGGTLILLNGLRAANTSPVGCVRSDARTQSTPLAGLGGRASVSPPPQVRSLCLPAARRPPPPPENPPRAPEEKKRGEPIKHFFYAKSPTNSAGSGLETFFFVSLEGKGIGEGGGGDFSHEAIRIRFAQRSAHCHVFSMDFFTVEVPWESNY